ncbi:hypothetical protein GOBAR_DD27394 [Gossypium barbadense]|nr:hypothetical protein GOBAR_DD27394 [Gossypium barbadense]
MDPSAPVTASLRAKLSQPARSETKGRPSAPWTRIGRRRRDPPAARSRPTPMNKADNGGQKACAMRHWAKAAASLRLGFAMPFC